MPRAPTLQDWLFSARCFAAAALTLWIAFTLDLSRPYWAMATVYIVSQPFAGAMRAKALWRLVGTAGGGAFSVLVMPNLTSAPEMMVLVLALWTGGCLAAASFDPTQRSYGFLLSGYTTALICFPIVDTPEMVFDSAINRVIEISLGILCAWLMHGVLFAPVGTPRLLAGSRAWLGQLAGFAASSLTEPQDAQRFSAARRRIARDGAGLAALFQQTRYEARDRLAQQLWLPRLHRHARALPALLTAIGDRQRSLHAQDPEAFAALQPLLASIAGWMADSIDQPAGPQRLATAKQLAARITEAGRAPAPAPSWAALVREGLLHRLQELLDHWRETLELTSRLLSERPAEAAPQVVDRPPGHVDPLLVGLSGFASAVSVVISCLIWIGAGWSHGASMAMMAAVSLCIFGQMDDPAPALRGFLLGACLAVAAALVYQFGVLPRIDGFPLLMMVLAVTYLPAAALITQPAQLARALAFCATVPAVLNLQENISSTDFATSLEGGIATAFGILLALLLSQLIRSFGVTWRVQRLARADRRDLASLASGRDVAEIRSVLGPMLDRFEALAARLGAADASTLGVEELADLRAGVNVVRLRERLPEMPAGPRAATEALLAALAREACGDMTRNALLPVLDNALRHCAAADSRPARHAALSLSGIRLALFPRAEAPVLPPERSLAA